MDVQKVSGGKFYNELPDSLQSNFLSAENELSTTSCPAVVIFRHLRSPTLPPRKFWVNMLDCRTFRKVTLCLSFLIFNVGIIRLLHGFHHIYGTLSTVPGM